MTRDVYKKAIDNIDQMMEVTIMDMSVGGVYVKQHTGYLLDLFNLKDKLKAKMPKK